MKVIDVLWNKENAAKISNLMHGGVTNEQHCPFARGRAKRGKRAMGANNNRRGQDDTMTYLAAALWNFHL